MEIQIPMWVIHGGAGVLIGWFSIIALVFFWAWRMQVNAEKQAKAIEDLFSEPATMEDIFEQVDFNEFKYPGTGQDLN